MSFLDKHGKEYTVYDLFMLLFVIIMIPAIWISNTHKGDKNEQSV